jgi:hypothetical protein
VSLDILCVTKGEEHADRFIQAMEDAALVLGAGMVVCFDGLVSVETAPWVRRHQVATDGTIESVLDEAIDHCQAQFVLRLDDDERMTPAMVAWLRTGEWMTEPLWAFPRLNLWGDEEHFIKADPLYPDLQTRLSTREKAGGRRGVHDGSPFGTGRIAPVAIEHHKFLVRDKFDRQRIAEGYEAIRQGAGLGEHYVAFNLPEIFYGARLPLMVKPWPSD